MNEELYLHDDEKLVKQVKGCFDDRFEGSSLKKKFDLKGLTLLSAAYPEMQDYHNDTPVFKKITLLSKCGRYEIVINTFLNGKVVVRS